jgi:hypothetical protein
MEQSRNQLSAQPRATGNIKDDSAITIVRHLLSGFAARGFPTAALPCDIVAFS